MRTASHLGTLPVCRGKSALPVRRLAMICGLAGIISPIYHTWGSHCLEDLRARNLDVGRGVASRMHGALAGFGYLLIFLMCFAGPAWRWSSAELRARPAAWGRHLPRKVGRGIARP